MLKVLVLMLLGVVVVAVACGGGDDDGNDQVATSAPAAAPAENDDAPAAPTQSDDSAGNGNNGGGGLNLLDDDCRFVLGSGFDATSFLQPDGESDLSTVAAAWRAITDRAPGEIRGELRVMADAFIEMAEIFDDIDLSNPQAFADPENQAAFEQLNDVFDTDRFNEASEAVDQWFDENCAA